MQNKEPSEFSCVEGESHQLGEESISRSKRFRSEDNTQNLESWLVFCYPQRQIEIIQSQGPHSSHSSSAIHRGGSEDDGEARSRVVASLSVSENHLFDDPDDVLKTYFLGFFKLRCVLVMRECFDVFVMGALSHLIISFPLSSCQW